MNKLGLIIINLAIIVVLYMIYSIVKIKDKKQTHYSFLAILGSLFIWIFGTVVLEYYYLFTGTVSTIALYIAYIGLILSSPCILILGIVFSKSDKIKIKLKYILIFLIPFISIIILLTNNIHHLFYEYIKYDELTSANSLGKYFSIHTIYSYVCILIGMALLVISSVKNTGIFSKQSICILLGILTTFIFNFLVTIQVIHAYFYTNTIFIFFSLVFFFIAIFKFKFLNLLPIALQKVVNIISDGYVVLNENNKVIDFNESFSSNISIHQGQDFMDALSSNFSDIVIEELIEIINKSKAINQTMILSQKLLNNEKEKYFNIEITPLITENEYRGTILLFKDITELTRTQDIMVEQERLSSLGQLIGGIAHNLKTPIMSIAGVVEGLTDLIKEYDESIDDPSVNKEDHHEIAKDMQNWVDKVKPYLSYMTEVIDAVKGQAVSMNANTMTSFSIKELITRTQLLMKNELKRRHCNLNLDISANEFTCITGEISALIQVIDNLIINAMDAYKDEAGDIDIKVREDETKVYIDVTDYAGGIPQKVQDKLFKEMITSKGKNGTGLGLYMSFSTIKGKFKGDIRFETEEGKGTTFFIELPKYLGQNTEQ